MIIIKKSQLDLIIEQAGKEAPLEACGYLAGTEGSAELVIPMTNADASADHFSFLPKEQFAALKQSRSAGLSLIAVYHSHPVSPARPSQEDIRLAFDPAISYLIVSLAEEEPVIRSYRITHGSVHEEPLEVYNDSL